MVFKIRHKSSLEGNTIYGCNSMKEIICKRALDQHIFGGDCSSNFFRSSGQIQAIQLGESCVGHVFLHPKFWQII